MILLFWLHVAATLFMTGLIWFVQVVHYPLFAKVGPREFAGYEADHSRRTTWVVAPVMSVELVGALVLLVDPLAGISRGQSILLLSLVVLIWASTALFQVPRHRELSAGFNTRSWNRLVMSNWLRTAAWTLRSCLLIHLLADSPRL